MLVAALVHALSTMGFSPRQDWTTSAGGGAFPSINFVSVASPTHALAVRCVEIFDSLHIHARYSEPLPEEPGAGLVRTMTLRLDPTDYIYPSSLLTFHAFVCPKQGLAVRLHELLTRINTALLWPLCYGTSAEIPSFSGLNDSLLQAVCQFLPATELLALDMCCRRSHAIASRDELWQCLGDLDFHFHSKHLLFHNMTKIGSKKQYLSSSGKLYSRRKVLAKRSSSETSSYPWPDGGHRLAFSPFPPLATNLGGGGMYL